MRETIRGYADAVLETAAEEGRVRQVADQLAAVVDLVSDSEDLRGVLADPGVPAAHRRAVIVDLLGSRLGADVVGLVGHTVESDRAPEMVANLNAVARDAAAAADTPVDEVVLGRTAALERIDGYATAVLGALEDRESLGNVEEEIFRFTRVVDGSEGLEAALTDRDLPAERRAAVVADLLRGRVAAATLRLVTYTARVARARDFPATLSWLVERVAAEAQRRVADVRAAVALDADQRSRLGQVLGRIIGHPVEVRVAVAPDLLGGFVAAVGDTLVDGSVRHRLELLRERITLPEISIPVGGAGAPAAGDDTNDQSTTREP